MTEKDELIVGLTPEEIEAIEGHEYTSRERTELEEIYEDNLGSRQIRPGSTDHPIRHWAPPSWLSVGSLLLCSSI